MHRWCVIAALMAAGFRVSGVEGCDAKHILQQCEPNWALHVGEILCSLSCRCLNDTTLVQQKNRKWWRTCLTLFAPAWCSAPIVIVSWKARAYSWWIWCLGTRNCDFLACFSATSTCSSKMSVFFCLYNSHASVFFSFQHATLVFSDIQTPLFSFS